MFLGKRASSSSSHTSPYQCKLLKDIYIQMVQVGSGSYGSVYKAAYKDDQSKIVALKKIEVEREAQGVTYKPKNLTLLVPNYRPQRNNKSQEAKPRKHSQPHRSGDAERRRAKDEGLSFSGF